MIYFGWKLIKFHPGWQNLKDEYWMFFAKQEEINIVYVEEFFDSKCLNKFVIYILNKRKHKKCLSFFYREHPRK